MSSIAVTPGPGERPRRWTTITRSRLIPAGVMLLLSLIFFVEEEGERNSAGWVAAGWILLACALSLFAIAVYERARQVRAAVAAEDHVARREIDQALEQLGSELDLRDLLRVNRRQMQAYETLTRRQAASSYRLSHIALVVGMLVLVGGSTLALTGDDATTQVLAAAVATVGGALSGFIARTYLRIYERTLEQLNHYFEQPLVASYVLTAERLIDRMGPERRDDAFARVVEELMDWRTPPPTRGRSRRSRKAGAVTPPPPPAAPTGA